MYNCSTSLRFSNGSSPPGLESPQSIHLLTIASFAGCTSFKFPLFFSLLAVLSSLYYFGVMHGNSSIGRFRKISQNFFRFTYATTRPLSLPSE
jgi:hypothetical protein